MFTSVGIVGFLILVLDVYAVVKVLGSTASAGAKTLWILLIFFLPVVGLILWALMGPK